MQSISKPLTYGLALEQLGWEAVRRRSGVEPSGEAFNEVSLAPSTGTPVNPMINAGAIACASLVASVGGDPLEALLAQTVSVPLMPASVVAFSVTVTVAVAFVHGGVPVTV